MKNTEELEKAGITVLSKIPVNEVNKIAKVISEKICQYFPEHGINQANLFDSLSKVEMYYARFKDNCAAKYCYKTETLFFSHGIDFEEPDSSIIHECIHYIQTVKKNNGSLYKLGLFKPGVVDFLGTGLALNEAAVQLMASYAANSPTDVEKYYGLDITTNSPDYYPIECALVKQMAYFTGTYALYHSTLYSDDIFKNTFIMKSNEKTYNKIVENLDLINESEDALQKASLYLPYAEYVGGSKAKHCQEKIDKLKNLINKTALKTQELILTSCARSDLNLVKNAQDLKEFKNKLYKFSDVLIQSRNYTFYNDFYCQMMEELDIKRELIKKYGVLANFNDAKQSLALIETRRKPLNLFKVAWNKIKEVFKINQESTNTETNQNEEK